MKLIPEVRAIIKQRFDAAKPGEADRNISALAREYGVSRQYIQFIVHPERLTKVRTSAKERSK